MTISVGILDYGMGNLKSVANAIKYVGGSPHIVSDPSHLCQYDKIIVPGVGAYPQAIRNLRVSNSDTYLKEAYLHGIPILGICLGMQLFCLSSEEGGFHEGLGWINARVVPFPSSSGLKVPHIGWDNVIIDFHHPLVQGIRNNTDFYFVHSFYVDCFNQENVLLSAEYGVTYCAMFVHDNIAGVQFHPEKSQESGLLLLENFLKWQPC